MGIENSSILNPYFEFLRKSTKTVGRCRYITGLGILFMAPASERDRPGTPTHSCKSKAEGGRTTRVQICPQKWHFRAELRDQPCHATRGVPGEDPAPRVPPSGSYSGNCCAHLCLPFSLSIRSAFSIYFFLTKGKFSRMLCKICYNTFFYLCRMNLTPIFFFFATLLFMYTYKIYNDAHTPHSTRITMQQHTHTTRRQNPVHSPRRDWANN